MYGTVRFGKTLGRRFPNSTSFVWNTVQQQRPHHKEDEMLIPFSLHSQSIPVRFLWDRKGIPLESGI